VSPAKRPSVSVAIRRAGATQTVTGFRTRAAAQAWASAHVLPEDGLVVIEESAAASAGVSP
jgi:hypothetical protein